MRGGLKRLALLIGGTLALAGAALATDVRVQVTDPTLLGLVQDALKALSTDGRSFTLVNAPDTIFVLGGAAFSPDVASRSLSTTPPRVEFNPESPIPLPAAVQAELRRMLNLPSPQDATTTATSGGSTVAPPTPTTGASITPPQLPATGTAGTSTTGTSGTSVPALPTAGASTTGVSTTGTSSPATRAGKADLNSDGSVDPSDLAIFMANLGKRGANLPGDLNGDGKVDNADLQAFIKLYRLP